LEQIKSTAVDRAEIQKKVFSERIKILYGNLLTSVPANFVCAMLVFISLYRAEWSAWGADRDTSDAFILGWMIAVSIVSLFRMLILYLYRYHPRSNNTQLFIFIFANVLSALLWGMINSVFMPQDEVMHQMIIIVITAGVTAGGIQTLNASIKAAITYVCLIVGPLSIWLFMQASFIYTLVGFSTVAYIIFMVVTSVRGNKLLTAKLTLQYENQALIEEISITNAKLYEQSTHDALTSLYNRRYLDDVLTRELQRATREGSSLCVAMFDLDFFKSFNDSHGHVAGDEVLKFTAALMKSTFRETDICCRFGGEEFLVVMLNTSIAAARTRLEQFRELMKHGRVSFLNKALPPISVSIGIAQGPEQGTTVREILHAADTALYNAKKAGRDRVEVAAETLSAVTA
jgi:diguanylate cyclase (GGDEF)-like protein